MDADTLSYLLLAAALIGGFVLWWIDALPIESIPHVGQVLRIMGAPATVFCGQAAAGKSSLLEFLKDHPVPQYRRTYRIVTRLVVFHRIDGDKKVVLRNVHDVPAERLDILCIDIERLKPRLVLAILDGSVVALDGMDACASNPLARHPARMIFDQLELSLRAHGTALSVKVIGVLINKADLWCADEVERTRVVRMVEERLQAYPLLGSAVRQGQIEVFVRAIALIRPRHFETPDALEDIARHSARLSSETLMEFKGRANDVVAQAADSLRVAHTFLADIARRTRS